VSVRLRKDRRAELPLARRNLRQREVALEDHRGVINSWRLITQVGFADWVRALALGEQRAGYAQKPASVRLGDQHNVSQGGAVDLDRNVAVL
jgi:hypothetical protein